MQEAVVAARDLARWRAPREVRVTTGDVTSACRALTASRLSALARKITPSQTWDDLVLPADQLAQLRELCNQARYRGVVHADWGFERKLPLGKGISALFSGPPGTGKTMAAEVIATELAARSLPDRPLAGRQQVHRRDREEPPQSLRRSGREPGDSVFRRSGCAVRQALRGEGRARPLREHRGRLPPADGWRSTKASPSSPRTSGRTWTTRSSAGCASSSNSRFPDEEHRRRIWEVTFPREAPLGRGRRARRAGA